MSLTVKSCPIMEAIAKKLFGIEDIRDAATKRRMVGNAVIAAKDAAERAYGGFEMMEKHRENERLKLQNAEMLAMLKKAYSEMEFIANACKNEISLPFCMDAYTAECRIISDFIEKVEGENGK